MKSANILEEKVEKEFLYRFKNFFRPIALPLSVVCGLSFISCVDDGKHVPTKPKEKVQENLPPSNTKINYEINGTSVHASYSGSDTDGYVVDYEILLEGDFVNTGWVSVADNLDVLNNLLPGDYILKARAVDDKGAKDPNPNSIRFNIDPRSSATPIGITEVSVVDIPEESPFNQSTFDVISSNPTVKTKKDGGFESKLDLSDITSSEVIVLAKEGKPILLGYAIEGDRGVELSAQSTITALAMMNPIFVNASVGMKREIVQSIERDLYFRSLVNELEHLLKIGYTIFNIVSDEDFYLSINENLERLLQRRAGKSAVGEDAPYLEDLVGSDVKFINPRNIFYAAFISNLPDSTRRDLILLSPKKGFIDLDLYPPSFFAEPTERDYPLGDGGFGIYLHKGFSGNLDDNLDVLNHPAGMATIANVLEGIGNVLHIVSMGYDLYNDTNQNSFASIEGAVRIVDVKKIEGVNNFISDVHDKKFKEAFLDAVNLVYHNRDLIAKRIATVNAKKSAVVVASHLATVVPIAGQIIAAIKVGSALDQLPFFYDLAFAPSDVDYKFTQSNGVLGEYSPVPTPTPTPTPTNRVPDRPILSSPLDGAENVSLEILLDWEGSDPDSDKLTYTIYFEKNDSTPDQVLKSGLTESEVSVSNLENDVEYYWQIVVSDGKLNTNGNIWRFKTGEDADQRYTLRIDDSATDVLLCYDMTTGLSAPINLCVVQPINENFELPNAFEGYSYVDVGAIDYKAAKEEALMDSEEESPWVLFPVDTKTSLVYDYTNGEKYIQILVLEYDSDSRARGAYYEMIDESERRLLVNYSDLRIPKKINNLLNSIGAIAWSDNLRPNIHFYVSSYCVSYELDEQDEQSLEPLQRAARFGEILYRLNE